MHEEKKYLCDECDHVATQKGNLRRHKQSVHEGKKYKCDACDHVATRNEHLITHKLYVHEGKMSLHVMHVITLRLQKET